jgi:hypothetical protein
MARKRFSPEQIITIVREAEVLLNQSTPVAEVCKKLSTRKTNRRSEGNSQRRALGLSRLPLQEFKSENISWRPVEFVSSWALKIV